MSVASMCLRCLATLKIKLFVCQHVLLFSCQLNFQNKNVKTHTVCLFFRQNNSIEGSKGSKRTGICVICRRSSLSTLELHF